MDGSAPTATSGTIYSGPISITTTTVVRAVAYADTSNVSASITHTYIFLNDVIHQPASIPTAGTKFVAPNWPSGYLRNTYPNSVRPITVNYSIAGKAIFGTDFTLDHNLGPTGQMTIPPGVNSVTVTLTAILDHVKERRDVAQMAVTAGPGYKLSRQKKAKVVISDSP